MNLIIDAREACRSRMTGKGHWAKCCIKELFKREVSLTLLGDESGSWNALYDGVSEVMATVRQETIVGRGLVWHWRAAAFVRRQTSVSAYLSPTSFLVPLLLRTSVPCIPIVHDLIAFRGEHHQRRAVLIERLTLPFVLSSAHRVCAISQSTKTDLLRRFPSLDPTHIIPVFAGPVWEPSPCTLPREQIILSIGTLCPRKNQLRLIRAFHSLPLHIRSQYRLVLVGQRGWSDAAIVRAAAETPGVQWRSYLPDEECRALLSQATVFAFPSLYEGFGLPVLDALRSGTPVLTSARGSLAEVGGLACLYCDPESIASIRDGLLILLTDERMRRQLVSDGYHQAALFSWERTVDLLLSAMSSQ